MKDTLSSLLKSIATLPSLPAVAMRIIEEVKKDKLAIRELVDIISYDPALTAKILKVANSSFYALPYKVDSIEKAVNILGLEALKNIALSFVIVKELRKNIIAGFDHEHFWKRSVTAAVSTEMMASKLKLRQDDTFVTPLLMDIGILVMFLGRPDDYLKVLDLKRASNVMTAEVERSIYGFDHQDVGSEILKQWKIPENIYMPVAYHHKRHGYPSELSDIVNILMLSDMVSSLYHGSRSVEKLEEIKQLLQDRLDINETDIDVFIDSVAEKTLDILSYFEIDAGNMKPYSQILQEANEELGELNLSYEQLVVELKEAKKEAEELAVELWTVKEEMRELAIRDALTGLYNHRYFQEFMDKEMNRAKRYGYLVSLIMLDIDYFKRINDTYGHLEGDEVLRSIGKNIQQSIRTSDTATRYGGEEFAIILPQTDSRGAVVLAERLRKMVEKLKIKINDQIVKVTISVGITTYDPNIEKKSKTEIIELADKALYNSKQKGRNKLAIMHNI